MQSSMRDMFSSHCSARPVAGKDCFRSAGTDRFRSDPPAPLGQESFSFRPACSATAFLFVDRRCWWQSVVMKNRAFLIEHRFPPSRRSHTQSLRRLAPCRVIVMECHLGGALSWFPLAGVSRPHLRYRLKVAPTHGVDQDLVTMLCCNSACFACLSTT